MIGHLQSNKVKYIAPFISMIHSVDSVRLLEEVNKQALRSKRTIPCLLQVHIAEEETKFGFSPQEVFQFLQSGQTLELPNVKVCGLMGMATLTENIEQIRREFRELKKLFDKLKSSSLTDGVEMRELSMGMSGDYKIAVEEGSTMIRVGSAIFGER
jgi:pyridoxal phosphate enzyme (YggS family)